MKSFGVRCLAGLAGGLVILASAGPPAGATAAGDTTERVEKQLPLKRGGRLTLRISRGDITIQTWDRDMVELRVAKSSDSADEMSLVPVDIKAQTDHIEISSEYPAYAPKLLVKTDYELRIPAEADLKLVKTVSGTINIAGVRGRAIVRVETGAVNIEDFAGVLDVVTINAEVRAGLARLTPADTVYLDTFNGDVIIQAPKGVEPYLELRTLAGTIESSIPVNILRGSFSPVVARGANKSEAPVIQAVSVNGSIRVSQP